MVLLGTNAYNRDRVRDTGFYIVLNDFLRYETQNSFLRDLLYGGIIVDKGEVLKE